MRSFGLSFLLFLLAIVHRSFSSPSPVLEDDMHFLFKWPGVLSSNLEQDMKQNFEFVDILTNNNEKYKCSIPIELTESEQNEKNKENNQNQANIEPSKLIADNIYSRKFCSYRIESYWIYELCHGQYVKQYHETKTAGKRVVTQEYFLGYYDANKQEPDYFKQSDGNLIPNIHWKTLRGERVAMLGVKYTDGTHCEILNGVQREITVYYACDETGNDNIAGFEEISSCIYEMIVVTKWICSHPAYKVPDKMPKQISCYPVGPNIQAQPTELLKFEKEQISSYDKKEVKMTNQKGETFIIHYNKIEDQEGTFAAHSVDQEPITSHNAPQDQTQSLENLINNQINQPPPQPPQINDEAQREMILAFIAGIQCLTGGSGWWKYEICFGKEVIQFHEDEKTKKRTNIHLGRWIVSNHLSWLSKNPNKRPLTEKTDRSSFSLLYTEGDHCVETNKNRQVEVKFRCVKNKSHAISLYLLEPSTCEYLLAIESPWLCDLVQAVDVNGLQFATPPSPPEPVQQQEIPPKQQQEIPPQQQQEIPPQQQQENTQPTDEKVDKAANEKFQRHVDP